MSLKLVRISRLKQLQTELKLGGPMELGKAIGRKTNQTSDLLKGRTAFGEKIARSIEEFAAIPPGWLDVPVESREGGDIDGPDASTAAASIHVGRLFAGHSAGRKYSEPDAPVVGQLTLSPGWVARSVELQSGPKDLRFLHAADDSMEPTMRRGDLLLIDSGVAECVTDGIYVLHANDRVYIKRVRQRMDSSYDVSSDAAIVKTVDVLSTNQLEVLGRVLWVWRGSPA